jgi:hypothetical protein
MKTLNISNYIQPYLPRFIFSDYYRNYFEICLLDIIYFYFNNPILYDEKSIVYKTVKEFISQKIIYDIYCDTCDDIYNIEELNEEKMKEVSCILDSYKDELNRVNIIYDFFQKNYSYNENKKYKSSHLSYELGKRDKMSRCNIKQFIKNKLFKIYFERKFQYKFLNNKKIKEEDKTVIFILDIINKLFNNYINSIKYGIEVLQKRPCVFYYNEEYLPKICKDNFIEKNKDIYIKHLGFINNILITNSLNENMLNEGYIKISKPDNRIVIWFE